MLPSSVHSSYGLWAQKPYDMSPPDYSLRQPQYHIIETIRPLIEVHWGSRVRVSSGSFWGRLIQGHKILAEPRLLDPMAARTPHADPTNSLGGTRNIRISGVKIF